MTTSHPGGPRPAGPTLLAVTLLALGSSCPDEGLGRIGATCYHDGQCASGLCASETCLDPELDEDGDSLVNRIEGALRTDALLPDSDGDAVTDPVEVGDLATPADADGDGRIDAVESLLADADADCLVDQLDPHDGLSDPPGEAFPDACGDGRVSCLANPLVGTCAAHLGRALAECFRPEGGCYVQYTSLAEVAAEVHWDNGAHIAWTSAGDVTSGYLYGPEGAVCASFRSVVGGAVTSVSVQIPKGPGFSLRVEEDGGAIDVTCPGGEVVALRDDAMMAFEICSGLSSEQTCELYHDSRCTTDAECGQGYRCCPIGSMGDERMCIFGTSCPDAFQPPSG